MIKRLVCLKQIRTQKYLYITRNQKFYSIGNRYFSTDKKEDKEFQYESKLASSLLTPPSFKEKLTNFGKTVFQFMFIKLPQLIYRGSVFLIKKLFGKFKNKKRIYKKTNNNKR
jgi:hypothetical protein